jgi:hypothetical protein
MPLTGIDGNAPTSAGLVQDPVGTLSRTQHRPDATIEETVVYAGERPASAARIQINQNSFDRTLGSWVVTTPGCFERWCDTATSEAFVLLATSASPGPTDLEPINAIAISPVAKIAPTMAFALSHRSTVRRSSGDSLL